MYTPVAHSHAKPVQIALATPRNIWLITFGLLSCFILANAFGSVLLAGFLGFSFLIMAAWPRLTAEAIRYPMIWAMPVLCILSTLWSRDPDQSFRLGSEYLLTTLCGLTLARIQSPRSFISALMATLLLADVFSVLMGASEIISYTGQSADRGVFGSKNIFAFYNAWLLLTSLSVLADRRNPRLMRLLGVASFLTGTVLLLKARSVGAVAASGIGIVAFIFFYSIERIPPKWRGPVLLGPMLVGLIVLAILSVLLQTGGFGEMLQAVGKSSDLTGRADMWVRAREYIHENPVLGVGYQAFWVQGYVEAEGLWEMMHVPGRAGFHFHNLFYETAVELGFVGVFVFGTTFLVLLFRLLRLAFLRAGADSAYFAAFFIYILSRVYLEVDFIGPFSHGSLLLAVLWIYSRRSELPVRSAIASSTAWLNPNGGVGSTVPG